MQHYGGVPPRRAAAIRRALVEAVAPADRAWRATVINRGRKLFSQLHAFVGNGD